MQQHPASAAADPGNGISRGMSRSPGIHGSKQRQQHAEDHAVDLGGTAVQVPVEGTEKQSPSPPAPEHPLPMAGSTATDPTNTGPP